MTGFLAEVADWFTNTDHWIGSDGVPTRTLEHVWLAVLSTVVAAAVAIPPAVYLAHRRIGAFTANALVNIGRAVPSFGIIVVAGLIFINAGLSLRFWPIVVALVALALPPIFTNAYAGISSVESSIVESARGMGYTDRQVLRSLEIPLATPVILAGVRIAFVQVMATVPLGAILSSGGGLGQYIVRGFAQGVAGRAEVFCGALLVALLTVLADWVWGKIERAALPAGVQTYTSGSAA